MKAQFVNENINFERGKDPKKSMGVGVEGVLGSTLKDMTHQSHHSRRCAAEVASEFEDMNSSKIYYVGSIAAGEPFDKEYGIEKLLPYIKEENMISKREPGTGTVLRSFNTPYGKVVFEGTYGMPPYGNGWVDKETATNLLYDIKVNESVRFERGNDPKKSMGLGIYEFNTEFHNFSIDPDEEGPDGNPIPDMHDPDTVAAVQELNDIGVEWKIDEEQDDFGVRMKFKGTQEQIAKVLSMYTGEKWEEYIPALQQWDGKDERDLWDILNDWNLY